MLHKFMLPVIYSTLIWQSYLFCDAVDFHVCSSRFFITTNNYMWIYIYQYSKIFIPMNTTNWLKWFLIKNSSEILFLYKNELMIIFFLYFIDIKMSRIIKNNNKILKNKNKSKLIFWLIINNITIINNTVNH